jgi:hypothetical protein
LKEHRNLLLTRRANLMMVLIFRRPHIPGRELFTSIFFAQLIMALVIWGGWKLISLILG